MDDFIMNNFIFEYVSFNSLKTLQCTNFKYFDMINEFLEKKEALYILNNDHLKGIKVSIIDGLGWIKYLTKFRTTMKINGVTYNLKIPRRFWSLEDISVVYFSRDVPFYYIIETGDGDIDVEPCKTYNYLKVEPDNIKK